MTPKEKVGADEGTKTEAIGFKCYEEVGTPIYHYVPDASEGAELQKVRVEDAEGKDVLVPGLMGGYHVMKVQGNWAKTECGRIAATLESRDGYMYSICLCNLAAIKKLALKS